MKQELKTKQGPVINLEELTKMVQRRIEGEPLQYILGRSLFNFMLVHPSHGMQEISRLVH